MFRVYVRNDTRKGVFSITKTTLDRDTIQGGVGWTRITLVDPAGIEPALSGANADRLTIILRAQGPIRDI